MLDRFIKLVTAIAARPDTSEEGAYIKKILTEYRNKRPLYEEFCAAVHKLLEAFLEEKNYKYQLASRTKTVERLREKLLRKSAAGIRYAGLGEIEDLAGIRVLFYSEADKVKFVKQLKKEMDGAMHIEHKKQRSGYEATHITMMLGEKRLQLSEYKHFSGLKIEIQVTSILRHTWAEIEHDFIYKDVSGLKKRDPAKFAIMERKLGQILEKHIKQASLEFEDVIKLLDE